MPPCRRFQHPVEGVEPDRRFQFHFAQHRLQGLGHIGKIHFGVGHAGRCELAEILHQQKINLVADDVGFNLLGQEVLDQALQPLLVRERTGLQELAQLVHLDQLVHLVQPVVGLFDHILFGRLDAGFQLGAGFQFDGELARQFGIDGM
jgi:hypothetical protein